MPNTQRAIDRVSYYRHLPNIRKGTPCEVDGEIGVIWGGNPADNLDVRFNDGRIRSCHPGWRMKILNDNGGVLYESSDE